jgi:zinc transport system permease protein
MSMPAFFQDMAINPLLVTGLLAGLFASVACGVIGPYVIAKRIVFLAGAIAHVTVGGIGAAIFLRAHWPALFGWMTPLHGAVAVALISAVITALVSQNVAERMDTLIGAMWAVGMALGVLLIKFTPGYHTELMSYLFGNIAVVSWADVWRMAALDLLILAAVAVNHKRLLAWCMDEEFAALQGVDPLWTTVLMLGLVALAVVALMQVVGLILVIALLTLPAATAAHHVTRLAPMMAVATILCLLLTTGPRVAVYGSRVSPESAIVLAAAAVYLLSVVLRRVRNWRRPAELVEHAAPVQHSA